MMSQQTELSQSGWQTVLPLSPTSTARLSDQQKPHTQINHGATIQGPRSRVPFGVLTAYQSNFLDLISQLPWLCGGLSYSESILTVMKKREPGLCLAPGVTGAGT